MGKQNTYIVAGPNGSGKTTFARLFLPGYVNCPNFVNADLIAQGLAPFGPQKAAMMFRQKMSEGVLSEAYIIFSICMSHWSIHGCCLIIPKQNLS